MIILFTGGLIKHAFLTQCLLAELTQYVLAIFLFLIKENIIIKTNKACMRLSISWWYITHSGSATALTFLVFLPFKVVLNQILKANHGKLWYKEKIREYFKGGILKRKKVQLEHIERWIKRIISERFVTAPKWRY